MSAREPRATRQGLLSRATHLTRASWLPRSSRLARRHRRLLAAVTLAAAVVAGLHAVQPQAPATRPVTVAEHDLPAGHTVTESDVNVVPWPPSAVPDGLVADPSGSVLAAPVRRGEPLTDVRMARSLGRGAGSGALPPGRLAMAVRMADDAAAALLRRGQPVDVLAADPQAAQAISAEVVVSGAVLLEVATPGGTSAATTGQTSGSGLLGLTGTDAAASTAATGAGPGTAVQGTVVVVAVTASQAARLAAAQVSRILTVIGHLDP